MNLAMGDKSELSDDEFFKRDAEITTITSLLNQTQYGGPSNILLTGEYGVGKTVLLKHIKKSLDKDYLVVYLNFKHSPAYQKKILSDKALMRYLCKNLITHAADKGLSTHSADDINEFDLPIKLYELNKDKIKGVIVFIDEFQIITESFLEKFMGIIQKDSHVSYVMSATLKINNHLIGQLSFKATHIHLNPFTPLEVRQYLSEKSSNLMLGDSFNKFYELTRGMPYIVNFFARLLPKDVFLTAGEIESEFSDSLEVMFSHLIFRWFSLTGREKNIVISLIEGPLKRAEIAKAIERTSTSLSIPLKSLYNLALIDTHDGYYWISHPELILWLKKEYEKNGVYPYRTL